MLEDAICDWLKPLRCPFQVSVIARRSENIGSGKPASLMIGHEMSVFVDLIPHHQNFVFCNIEFLYLPKKRKIYRGTRQGGFIHFIDGEL